MSNGNTMTPEIFGKMAELLGEIGAIGKTERNEQQSFNFRSIDQVMNMLHPILSRLGIFYTQTILETTSDSYTTRNNAVMNRVRVHVAYTWHAPDGSHVTSDGFGEGADSGDKAAPKALASALKYMLLHTLCIPTEEQKQDDADRHAPEPVMKLNPTVEGWLRAGVPATNLHDLALEVARDFNTKEPADLSEIRPSLMSAESLVELKARVGKLLEPKQEETV